MCVYGCDRVCEWMVAGQANLSSRTKQSKQQREMRRKAAARQGRRLDGGGGRRKGNPAIF